MKKKVLGLLLVFALALSSCGSGDPLDAIKGANSTQKSAIQDVLDDCDITVKSCSEATLEGSDDDLENALVSTMLTNFTPYDITDEEGNIYRMVIKKEDYSVFSINKDGETIYSGIGSLWG